MAATASDAVERVDTASRDALRYDKDLPEDISASRELLEEYSGVPSDEVAAHIYAVREKAWKVHPYPCVGRFRFLDLSISLHPLYPTVLSRLKDSNQTLLDLGCCFGQDIRRLVSDGAPSENLYGADLRLEFLELGYELFKDKGRLKAHFLEGDVLDDEGEGGPELKNLMGKIDIIHAASFLHLFTWDDQIKAGSRMVRLFRPTTKDAMVLGRQVGTVKPGEYPGRVDGRTRYRHDPQSFQKLWDVIGDKTGTKWKVDAELLSVRGWWSKDQSEPADEYKDFRRMQFAVHRVA